MLTNLFSQHPRNTNPVILPPTLRNLSLIHAVFLIWWAMPTLLLPSSIIVFTSGGNRLPFFEKFAWGYYP